RTVSEAARPSVLDTDSRSWWLRSARLARSRWRCPDRDCLAGWRTSEKGMLPPLGEERQGVGLALLRCHGGRAVACDRRWRNVLAGGVCIHSLWPAWTGSMWCSCSTSPWAGVNTGTESPVAEDRREPVVPEGA